jgi:putative flippase GtrA
MFVSVEVPFNTLRAWGYVTNLLALTAFSARMPLLLAQLTAVVLVMVWNALL